VVVGFGITTPEAARSIAAVADGSVVGSAIVADIGSGMAPADVLARIAALAEAAHSA
jgi:tryptophan synthase alpha chain